MVKSIVCFGASTLALLPAIAPAQDAASLAIHRRLEATYPAPSPERLLPKLQAAAASAPGACKPSALAILSVEPASADQVVIGQLVHAHAHQGWIARARPTGCAGVSNIAFLAIEDANGDVDAAEYNIGETLAWPSLAHDATLPVAVTAAALVEKSQPGCARDRPARIGTRVVSRGVDLAAPSYGVIFHGAWRERWTYAGCGRTVSLDVDFLADGDGGADFHAAAAPAVP